MMRCRMIMRASIDVNDAAALLALKDELKLTDAQVPKLQTIADNSRKEAKALLTDEQQKKLQGLSETPGSMMQMHESMMPMMQQMMGMKESRGMGMMCPMMMDARPSATSAQPPEAKPTK